MEIKTIDWKIVCIGMICLTGYGIYAASQRIDGKLMTAIIAIIALAIGVVLPNPLSKQ